MAAYRLALFSITQWLVWSITVQGVSEENCLHYDKWVFSFKRVPVVSTQMWLACEEGFLSCTVRSFHPLWLSLLVLTVFHLFVQKSDNTLSLRCYEARKPLYENESRGAWGDIAVYIGATSSWAVFFLCCLDIKNPSFNVKVIRTKLSNHPGSSCPGGDLCSTD